MNITDVMSITVVIKVVISGITDIMDILAIMVIKDIVDSTFLLCGSQFL
jgi:hypothetical protein